MQARSQTLVLVQVLLEPVVETPVMFQGLALAQVPVLGLTMPYVEEQVVLLLALKKDLGPYLSGILKLKYSLLFCLRGRIVEPEGSVTS